MTSPDEGLLLVDKPSGWTSHDVVAALRRRLPKGVKVGHSGTLDPMATGLLILLIGPATKRASELQGLPKVYSGTIRLGVETDTADITGKVLREAAVPSLSAEALAALFTRLVGKRILPVPRYAAVKLGGKPLYKYARAGQETPEVKREMEVTSWELTSWEAPEAGFRLACASGVYVRSLAELVGRELGCGATLSSLRRESIAGFRVPETGPFDPKSYTHALPA
ncbi:MAG: tRNA pseudouridine(55) synthase TruB [Elusimicrobia bacterium]|nr:tRNA pseudouridine(55) synthase TruB [Elusimicrobiota bacterium]